MLELSSIRKNKVNLIDYNSEQDIDNRMMISELTLFEHGVLQEIFFSSLKVSLQKLAHSVGCEEQDLSNILTKLAKTGLLTIQDGLIVVDKEMRKYFEFHMKRFEPDFKPDMELLQGLLKKVPIHLLTSWYAIPRTSNNIFESIIEKYLLTPQVFHRYLNELHFADPRIEKMIQDILSAPGCRILSKDLMAKYNFTRKGFEEAMLLLEFHFVCCLTYTQKEGCFVEWVSPFYEWHQYLLFLKETETPLIPSEKSILRKQESDFSFIEDLSALLLSAKKNPILISQLKSLFTDVDRLITKLCLIGLAEQKEGYLHILETGILWLDMNLEKRALHLYRHWPSLSNKNLREAEKSVKRVTHGKWVFFDDFMKGVRVFLNEHAPITLTKVGKSWKYVLPSYDIQEVSLIKETVLQWLFEVGMVAPGTCDGKDCFCVTSFGRSVFEE